MQRARGSAALVLAALQSEEAHRAHVAALAAAAEEGLTVRGLTGDRVDGQAADPVPDQSAGRVLLGLNVADVLVLVLGVAPELLDGLLAVVVVSLADLDGRQSSLSGELLDPALGDPEDRRELFAGDLVLHGVLLQKSVSWAPFFTFPLTHAASDLFRAPENGYPLQRNDPSGCTSWRRWHSPHVSGRSQLLGW